MRQSSRGLVVGRRKECGYVDVNISSALRHLHRLVFTAKHSLPYEVHHASISVSVVGPSLVNRGCVSISPAGGHAWVWYSSRYIPNKSSESMLTVTAPSLSSENGSSAPVTATRVALQRLPGANL